MVRLFLHGSAVSVFLKASVYKGQYQPRRRKGQGDQKCISIVSGLLKYPAHDHGAQQSGDIKSDEHDPIIDTGVFPAELPCGKTGVHAHEGTEADSDQADAHIEQPCGTISAHIFPLRPSQ